MKKRLATMMLLGGVMLGGTANASTICVCVGIGSTGGGCGSNAIGANFGQYFANVSNSDLESYVRKQHADRLSSGASSSEYSSQTGWLCTRERR